MCFTLLCALSDFVRNTNITEVSVYKVTFYCPETIYNKTLDQRHTLSYRNIYFIGDHYTIAVKQF